MNSNTWRCDTLRHALGLAAALTAFGVAAPALAEVDAAVRDALALHVAGKANAAYALLTPLEKVRAGDPDFNYALSGVAAFGAVAAATSMSNQFFRSYGDFAGGIYNAAVVSQPDGRLDSFVSGTVTFGRGTTTDREFSVAGAVGWTRWDGGTTTGIATGTTTAKTIPVNGGGGMVCGTAATGLPTSGTATYSMAGATGVVSSDGSITPGVVRSDSLAVSFSSALVGFTSVLGVSGSDFTFALTGGTAAPSMPLTATGTFDGRGGGGRISGFLSGVDGANAGVAFIAPLPGSTTASVNGAIGFTKN